MTYIVSGGALNSTHSLTWVILHGKFQLRHEKLLCACCPFAWCCVWSGRLPVTARCDVNSIFRLIPPTAYCMRFRSSAGIGASISRPADGAVARSNSQAASSARLGPGRLRPQRRRLPRRRLRPYYDSGRSTSGRRDVISGRDTDTHHVGICHTEVRDSTSELCRFTFMTNLAQVYLNYFVLAVSGNNVILHCEPEKNYCFISSTKLPNIDQTR